MGNVQSSSNLPISPPRTPQKLNSENRIKNPGSVDELHEKCKELFPVTFEGTQFVISKKLSHTFFKSHILPIEAMSQISVILKCKYLENIEDPSPPFSDYPVGKIPTNVNIEPWENVKITLSAEVQGFKTTAEYKTDRYTAALCLVDPDIFECTGTYTSQCLYALNNNTSVGVEVIHQRSPQIPKGHLTVFNVFGRYIYNDATTVSTTLSLKRLQCCYHFKASEQLQFGVDLEGSLLQRDIDATFAYQVKFPKSDINIKGTIDKMWNVNTTLEKRFYLIPFTFALSAMFSPANPDLRMGVGILIGSFRKL